MEKKTKVITKHITPAHLGWVEKKGKTKHIFPAHLGWTEKFKLKKPHSSSPGLGGKTKQHKTEHYLHKQNPIQSRLCTPL